MKKEIKEIKKYDDDLLSRICKKHHRKIYASFEKVYKDHFLVKATRRK